jgi:phosphocarrier protein HPr
MREETLTVINKIGLHARPAALLVKTAAAFASEVTLVKADKTFNAKSILTVMAAGVRQGDSVTVRASGADEEAAVAAVAELFKSGFGEE